MNSHGRTSDVYFPLRLKHSVLPQGRKLLAFCWGVFWKVTAVVTALLFVLFFTLHHDDLAGPLPRVAFAVVVILGYCLFIAVWVGLAASAFALACRWLRWWIIIPIFGALAGALAAFALAFALLSQIDFRGAGPHGGGDIAAFLIIGLLVVSVVIGAMVGGVLGSIPAIVAASIRPHRSAAPQE